jgi:hypothetical protein
LLPVESNFEDEIVEVPSTHRYPSSGGGRRNSRLDFFTSSRLSSKALNIRELNRIFIFSRLIN